jgi:hypothetical protein
MFTAKTSSGELLCEAENRFLLVLLATTKTLIGKHRKVLLREPSGKVFRTLWCIQGKVFGSKGFG